MCYNYYLCSYSAITNECVICSYSDTSTDCDFLLIQILVMNVLYMYFFCSYSDISNTFLRNKLWPIMPLLYDGRTDGRTDGRNGVDCQVLIQTLVINVSFVLIQFLVMNVIFQIPVMNVLYNYLLLFGIEPVRGALSHGDHGNCAYSSSSFIHF